MSDVAMRILMSVVGSREAMRAVGDLSKSLGGGGGLSGVLLGVGTAAAGLAIALGENAIEAAGDFEAQTTRLVTSAGELDKNLGMVRDGLLQMSVDTATSTEQLAAGMYYVESAGYHAADGLEVMRAAAEGAKSENANLDVVAKALTTVMTDYHMSASDAADAMNGLIATVQNGKTNLQDLSSSMGAVLPIASSFGISFAEVAGVMDTMTNAGYSSRNAAQNLAHVLVSLESPSGIAVKAMKSVGLTADEVKNALANEGLPEALQMIEDAVGKKFPKGSVAYNEALKNILGGMTGLKLASTVTGDNLDKTKQNIDNVADAMKNGKGKVSGFAEVQQTFNFKMDKAKDAIGAVAIKIGEHLLPIAGKIADFISANLNPTLQHLIDFVKAIPGWWDKWGPAVKTVALVITAFFIPSMLKGVVAAGSWAKSVAGSAAEAVKSNPSVQFWSRTLSNSGDAAKKAATETDALATAEADTREPAQVLADTMQEVAGILKEIATQLQSVTSNYLSLSDAQTTAGEAADVATPKVEGLATAEQAAADNADAQKLTDLATAEQAVADNADAKVVQDLANAEMAAVESADAAKLQDLANAEKAVTANAAESAAVQDLATAEQAVVTKADAGALSGFATEEAAVGTSAAEAGGAAGLGALLGPLGAIVALLPIAIPLASSFSDAIANWMGAPNVGSEQNLKDLETFTKSLADQHNDAGFKAWIQTMKDLGAVTDAEAQKLQDLYNKMAHPPSGLTNTSSASSWLYNPPSSGQGYGQRPHARGGMVGPNEMLSMINDDDVGRRGEVLRLPSGTEVYTHNQSVAMLQNMAAGMGGGGVVYGGHTFYITLQTNFAPTAQQARAAVDMIEQELGRRVRGQTPGFNSAGVY